ncbi:f-box domain cyclin-like protein [Diplodia corticola]|uniref:F-box domain cyclin-like protein n=1 Tax=Diplodia corticola TaxID=236234 RepID=A0A1J9RE16_9PEZI|nr:f-box domain cyclin-like protein [Diplodia corticola]OJD39750.1 f-box domain cyclin-like protein [Diplodia corticola]
MAPNLDRASTPTSGAPRPSLAKIDTSSHINDDSRNPSPTSEFSFTFSIFERTASDGERTPTGLTRIDVISNHSRGESFSISSPTSDFSFRFSSMDPPPAPQRRRETVTSSTRRHKRRATGLTSISTTSSAAAAMDPFGSSSGSSRTTAANSRVASPSRSSSIFSYRVFTPAQAEFFPLRRMSSVVSPGSLLERLPAELHLELVGHLGACEARTLRLVSKYWRAVVSQWYKRDALSVRLPLDVQLRIGGYLDVESLIAMRATSRYWREVVKKHGKDPAVVHSTRSALLCTYDECLGRGTSMYWRLWIRILRTIQRENAWV